jgi:uncharacterized protein YukE
MEIMAKTKAPSRTQRWFDAVNKGKDALEKLQNIKSEIDDDLMDLAQRFADDLQAELDKVSDKLRPGVEALQDAFGDLHALREEYEEWYDNMPQQLQDGPTGEKLSEIVNQFDFDVVNDVDPELEVPQIEMPTVELDLDEYESLLDEAEAADLPLGFGRD